MLSTLIVGALLAGPAPAVVVEMTPERIREAIALGNSKKDIKPYGLPSGLGGSLGLGKAKLDDASYTTPFLRVALAANRAKQEYKTFTETDATPEMIEPVLRVYANPLVRGRHVNSVRTVIVKHKKSGAIVQPTSTEPTEESYSNAYGATAEGKGLRATFPLDVVNAEHEIRVVFEDGEAKQDFDLGKIR